MSKKEFFGKLSNISPMHIIDLDNKKDIQSFFLILGLIFNDIKGLIFFQKIIEDNYRKPDVNEVSAHSGEYNGLVVQAERLLIAATAEFISFLDKNKAVVNSINFQVILKGLNSENRKSWDNLVKFGSQSTTLTKIARVRSNIAFHYDHSMEELRRGFIDSFFNKRGDLIQHRHAYYSLGDDVETTRIHFSDAAAEDYVHSLIAIEDKNEIRKAIIDMNQSVHALLCLYLEGIKK